VFSNSGTVTVDAGSRFTSSGAGTWSGGSIGGAGNAVFNQYLDVTGDVVKPGAGTLRVGWWLTMAAGKRLDLTEGKMIVAQGLLGEGDSTGTYTGVHRLVQTARNGGAWNGPGITTSMPNAKTGLTTIGIATGKQARGLGATATATFGGETITATSVIAMYTYAGDANLDGRIDAGDYGVIDNNVQAQGAPFPTSETVGNNLANVTAVPEPSTCGFAILLTTPLLARHRRRRRRTLAP
jgi:hypothetical protein